MLASLLIANRGEIAVRVIRACRLFGIRSIAVYSDADAWAPHVCLADRAVRLGPAPAAESYLRIDALIRAARETGAEAVHPGYGFLSERAAFARACAEAGLTFVGPSPATLEAVGDKVNAKRLAAAAGVPVIPGLDDDVAALPPDALRAAAAPIGLPLLVKARAGGGGKGMRFVRDLEALPAAVATASSEARAAFGDPDVYLERALTSVRHVEVQILRDAHGHTLALPERECSVQRRHQKLIEESPSPAVDDALRARLQRAAAAVADAADYLGAGTVEFLLAADGAFYFLEVNARLQVEHPVTEMLTGVDLVAEQLRIASGAPISEAARAARPRGHAIEARINAEDAAGGFLPSTGRILALRAPSGPGVRFDAGIEVGSVVTHPYDPMLAKLIAWGEDRETARRRLLAALRELTLVGVETCQPFHLAVCELPAFKAGDLDTAFLERPDVQASFRRNGHVPLAALGAALAHLRRNGAAGAAARPAAPRTAWGRDALRRGLRGPPGGPA